MIWFCYTFVSIKPLYKMRLSILMKMKIILSISVTLILFCMGCGNPFSIRNAEEPVNPSSSWTPPHSAEEVLTNLIKAIEERNIENYMRCLIDSSNSNAVFQFDPDPILAVEYASVFSDWNDQKEKAVMNLAFSKVPTDSLSKLVFTEDIKEISTPDSVVFIKKYRLELHHTDVSLPVEYEGQVEFWFTEDRQGWWAIYRWIDNSVSDYRSWSYLKAVLSG
jgi:hypothetical protein